MRARQLPFIDRTDNTVNGEDEFLYAPYSVFTVRAVHWEAEPRVNTYARRYHIIDVSVASDNREERDDLPLAPRC